MARVGKKHAQRLGIETGKGKPAPKQDPASCAFLALLKAHGLPEPELEYAFAAPLRRWRFDYAWPRAVPPVALEQEGGLWLKGGGRHNRAGGMIKDLAKYNRAALLGWLLLRCTPKDLKSGAVIPLLKEALAGPRRA